MSDELTRHKPHLEFLTVALHDGALYGVSRDGGQLYPLYVFAPLQQALLAGHHPPLAPGWEFYVRELVLRYIPVPALEVRRLPRDLESDFGHQSRDQDPQRNWKQMTYRYWPLYFLRPGLAAPQEPDRPLLFQPATRDLDWLHGPDGPVSAGPDEPPVTFPPPNLGP